MMVRLSVHGALFGALALVASGCTGGLSTEAGDECGPGRPCPTGYACIGGGCHMELPGGGGCTDEDGDGFRTGPDCPSTEEIDCDDTDDGVNPSASEICGDLIDQNCSAGEDEGCECTEFGVGTTRSCGNGACSGVQTCNEDGWGPCSPPTAPQPEDCGVDGSGNGIDEDCNGDVDDGCVSCGDRPDGLGTEEVCFDDAGDPTYCSSNGTC
jgi:hypothetical protein